MNKKLIGNYRHALLVAALCCSASYGAAQPIIKINGSVTNNTNMVFSLQQPLKFQGNYTKIPDNILLRKGAANATFKFDWAAAQTSNRVSFPADALNFTYYGTDHQGNNISCTFYFATFLNGTPCWVSPQGQANGVGNILQCKEATKVGDGVCLMTFTIDYNRGQ